MNYDADAARDVERALEYEEAPNPDVSGYVGSPKPESSMAEVIHRLQALEDAVRELISALG